jgi:hypothetical protein
MTAEVVARLQQSFEHHADPAWQMRVAMHTFEAKIETINRHQDLLEHYRIMLAQEARKSGEAAPPRLKEELEYVALELGDIRAKKDALVAEAAVLERKIWESDRELVALLDRLADGAIQEELRALHAAEERLGVPAGSRGAVTPPEPDRAPLSMPMTALPMDAPPMNADLSAYEKLLEKALSKRDEKIRSWWQKEFGYDPDAPKVERPASKGPVKSHNAKRPKP